ncbi:hypothetical protein [Kordia sp.]|nr:hypothetical protein [Kordia sp.]
MEYDYSFNNKITKIMRKVMMYKGRGVLKSVSYDLTEREIGEN